MNNKHLEEALLLYGKEYTTYLKKAIRNNKPGKSYNSIYTGKLYNSIKAKVIEIGNELELLIEAESYITSLDQGVKPGTEVDLNELTKWVAKRLKAGRKSKQIAWLIQRKIRNYGTDPMNILKNAQINLLNNKNIMKWLSKSALKDLQDYLDESLGKILKNSGIEIDIK